MYRYKLTKLTLNDGSQVLPGKLTVFIGPNNVGKSRALKDISLLSTSSQPAGTVVVNEAEWTMPETAQDLFEHIRRPSRTTTHRADGRDSE